MQVFLDVFDHFPETGVVFGEVADVPVGDPFPFQRVREAALAAEPRQRVLAVGS